MANPYSQFVDYSLPRPEQFAHKLKLSQWNPLGTFNQSLGANDIVRFNIKGDDLWDPYSAYITLTIDFGSNTNLLDDATFTNKLIQLDSSMQSIFSQLIIYERSEELERIMQYDTLACILKDMSYGAIQRYSRDFEGLGGMYPYSQPQQVCGEFSNSTGSNTQKPVGVVNLVTNDLTTYSDGQAGASPFAINQNFGAAGTWTTLNWPILNQQLAPSAFLNQVGVTFGDVTQSHKEYVNNFTSSPSITDNTQNPFTVGPTSYFSPAFCATAWEPYFSATVLQKYLRNGFITCGTKLTATFVVPILSGIFGILMPQENYKYIPLKYFQDLVFEFQFSPYAFFTSWFTTNQASRQFQVKNMTLHAELLQPLDQGMLNNIDAQFQNGINIATQSFYLGPLYVITGGAVPPTVQINLGFESLRNIFFVFMPNDFTANAAARKQYRLSMGITSMQVKIGTDYYPSLAITGNGGNNYGSANNYEFYWHLLKAFGKHLDPDNSALNPHNFAVNFRAFDPTSADTNITGNAQGGFLEENRVVGKAIYALDLDSLNYEKRLLSGINTTMAKPFEIQLAYDSTKVFTRPVTMYVFCHYDMVLSMSPNGIKALGKA